MTSRPPPQCLNCAHFRSPIEDGVPEPSWPDGTGSCDAFPDKIDAIPDAIWWNKVDHRQPYDGDRGIGWSSVNGTAFPQWALNGDDASRPAATAAARRLALAGIEVRATTAEAGGGGGSGKKTAHEPAGSSKGGQFTSRPGGGGTKAAANHRRPKKVAPATQSVPQAPATPRLVKEGDSGEDVRYAQYAMSLLGFKVAQDGRFGPETAAAVKQMQQRLGVKHPNGHITPALLHKMQDAVRLSPCVGGQRSRSFEEGFSREEAWAAVNAHPLEHRDDGLEDGDLDFDETAEAVLDALDQFERSANIDWAERAAHDVSKELRIPGGKGGGRWTKSPITSAIAKALEEWAKGNGPDDPFVFDGKPIDREPLRKAAVARGITLKRGASRDDIVAALKADVGGKVREAKAAKAPEVGKPVRFTLKGKAHRNLDVGVFTEGGKVSLWEVSDSGQRRKRVALVADLAGLESWADEHGESELADWARKEKGGHREYVPPHIQEALDVLAGQRKPSLPLSVLYARVNRHSYERYFTPEQRKAVLDKLRQALPGMAADAEDRRGVERVVSDLEAIDGAAPDVPAKATTAEKKAAPADFDKRLSAAATGNDALAAAPRLVHYDEDADKWTVTGVPNPDRAGQAVHDYWDSGEDVNKYLRDGPEAYGRKGRKFTAAKVQSTIDGMDGLFESSKLDKPVAVWRGFDGREVFGGEPESWPDDLSGHEWTDKAYVSTAVDRVEAANFATGSKDATDLRGVMARVVLPEGAPVLAMGEFEAGEMLTSRGWRFRVVADHGWRDEKRGSSVRQQRLLDVEAIPPDMPEAPAAPAKATKAAKTAVPAAQPADLEHLRTLDTESRRDALDLRKVDELKTMLKAQGLRVSGKKRDLVDRLVEHLGGGTASVAAPPAAKPKSGRAVALGQRLDEISAESAPLRDFFARYSQSNFHSDADHKAYYANRQRLDELVQQGSATANELLNILVEENGEPWGGDATSDAERWTGGLALVDRGTLTPEASRRLRDKYVVDDRNTLIQNASLRSAEPTAAATSWASSVSKWIRSSEVGRDTTLYRGAALRPEQIAQLQPGSVLHDKGIVSTDRERGNADFYAGDRLSKIPGTIKTLFEVRAPQGSPAVEAGYGEIVLDRNGRFRIVSSRRDENGVVHVVMELLR